MKHDQDTCRMCKIGRVSFYVSICLILAGCMVGFFYTLAMEIS